MDIWDKFLVKIREIFPEYEDLIIKKKDYDSMIWFLGYIQGYVRYDIRNPTEAQLDDFILDMSLVFASFLNDYQDKMQRLLKRTYKEKIELYRMMYKMLDIMFFF